MSLYHYNDRLTGAAGRKRSGRPIQRCDGFKNDFFDTVFGKQRQPLCRGDPFADGGFAGTGQTVYDDKQRD
jgi:hypothetical protein